MNQIFTTDTLVVGAGPAGSVCAYLLHKSGVDCLLIDHATFPRDKICGGGLTVKAWTLLEDLMPAFTYPYQKINEVEFKIDQAFCRIPLQYDIRVVARKDFDHRLLQYYIASGGRFMQGAFSKFQRQADGQLLVTLKSGVQIRCRHLVGADGANSHIRKQLIGPYSGNILWLEQYQPKSRTSIFGELSLTQYPGGYYYVFPAVEHDVVGYGYAGTNMPQFRQILAEKGFEPTSIHGAYIPVHEVDSGRDDVILIGDAGGFANKLTFEGLYYAIATAQNAARAIIQHRTFRDTNADIFRRKRRERWLAALLYSRFGMGLIRWLAGHPSLLTRALNKGIKPD